MTRKSNPHRALVSAIAGMLAPLKLCLDDVEITPWASATFRGARHVFWLNASGEDAVTRLESFARGISEREFDLVGHIVADILVTNRSGPRCCIEALTVEVE